MYMNIQGCRLYIIAIKIRLLRMDYLYCTIKKKNYEHVWEINALLRSRKTII